MPDTRLEFSEISLILTIVRGYSRLWLAQSKSSYFTRHGHVGDQHPSPNWPPSSILGFLDVSEFLTSFQMFLFTPSFRESESPAPCSWVGPCEKQWNVSKNSTFYWMVLWNAPWDPLISSSSATQWQIKLCAHMAEKKDISCVSYWGWVWWLSALKYSSDFW